MVEETNNFAEWGTIDTIREVPIGIQGGRTYASMINQIQRQQFELLRAYGRGIPVAIGGFPEEEPEEEIEDEEDKNSYEDIIKASELNK